jgi:hypothetical protein
MAKGAELTFSQMQVAHDDLEGLNIARSSIAITDIEIILCRGFIPKSSEKQQKIHPRCKKCSVRSQQSAANCWISAECSNVRNFFSSVSPFILVIC